MPSAEYFLNAAQDTLRARATTYDKPEDEGERSMGPAVTAFNAITDRDLTTSEGWLLMGLIKRVRQYAREEYHADSALDAVAYAALEAESLANNE